MAKDSVPKFSFAKDIDRLKENQLSENRVLQYWLYDSRVGNQNTTYVNWVATYWATQFTDIKV
ncbi:MAG: hypothetical protein ABIX01_06930 [Chitinophagaceae bacterium]